MFLYRRISKRKQMSAKYTVRTTVFASGERFPLLVDRISGLPLFEPAIFCLTAVRAANRAAATIDQVARAISVLYLFVDAHDIDLRERMRTGRVLDLGEVEALARYCRLPLEMINGWRDQSTIETGKTTPAKVVSLEKVRLLPKAPLREVDPQSAGIRMRYIRDYLAWLTCGQLMKLQQNDLCKKLKVNADAVTASLNARLPSGGGRSSVGQREGMTPEAFERLLEVIDPAFPDNPWTSMHARERNALAVLWLLSIGLRRGELLGIRISDIDFRENQVLIARRADNIDDPRPKQPLVKTRDRIVPLEPALMQRTHRYITGTRRTFPGARKHDFLFVANGTGAPMSLDALNKAFATLREKCPELPDNLTPHVLRHTWNDRFSEHMDTARVSEEKESKMRSYLMGWSETSGTAATYTRRHVREKAKKVSLDMQNSLMKGRKKHGK